MTKEFFGFKFFSANLSILSFSRFNHNLTLTLLWLASWTMFEPLQLKRELRGKDILEGIVTPLNRAPINSKRFEKQFGSAMIGADFTQQIFLTPQRPLTSNILFLYSNWGLNFTIWVLILGLNFWCLWMLTLCPKGLFHFHQLFVRLDEGQTWKKTLRASGFCKGEGGDFIKWRTEAGAGMMGRSDNPLLLPSLAEVPPCHYTVVFVCLF